MNYLSPLMFFLFFGLLGWRYYAAAKRASVRRAHTPNPSLAALLEQQQKLVSRVDEIERLIKGPRTPVLGGFFNLAGAKGPIVSMDLEMTGGTAPEGVVARIGKVPKA